MKENVPAFPSCLCTPISLKMRAAFPELVIMSGDITTESGQVFEHTWLQTEDGSLIVDPTVEQFGEEVAEYAATLHDGTDPDCKGRDK
tara:strand:- start:158 stop:421 length:264 start_codon:yes stop_codon:yes gene_type:complete